MKEDLDKTAWEIYRTALKFVEFPQNVTVNENEDGSISFFMLMSAAASGLGFFYYKPSIELIKNILKMKSSYEIEVNFPEPFAEEMSKSLAESVAYLMLKNFHIEISETFVDLYDIPTLLMIQMMSNVMTESPGRSPSQVKQLQENSDKQLEELLNRRKQRTKIRIQDELNSAEKPSAPAKHLIASFYSGLLPRWEQAKNCYKRNRHFSNWQKMIEVEFEKLPTDLIERLSNADPYLSMPSSIALEHAARLCGIKNNSLGLRALQKYLKESREWIEKVGTEAAEAEEGRYFRRVMREVISIYQVAHWLGDQPKTDDLSLYHQIFVKVMGEKIQKILKNEPIGDDKNNEHEANSTVH